MEYRLAETDRGFAMSNPLHGTSIEFTATGPEITSQGRSWGLTLSGIGYQGAVAPVRAARLSNADGRMLYQRGEVSEWYLNSTWGIEQGFTLFESPGGGAEGALLVVELALSGALVPRLADDGLVLADAGGAAIARYAGLQVLDNADKELPARFELADETLRILIDDSGADYPLVIDPWIQKATLSPSDSGGFGGQSTPVAVSGDTVVIGAPGNSNDEGAAYVFEKPATGWADMTEVARLYASDGEDGDEFGISVAIDGDTVVVGAWGDLNSRGSAYVFEKPAGGWVTMFETAILTATTRNAFDFFGWSVAISGDTVVVGAYYSDEIGSSEGAAYVFVRPDTGWVDANETAVLSTTDHTGIDDFGKSVAIAGDNVVVGSNRGNGTVAFSGTAYVFVKPSGGWSDMTVHTAELMASDGAANDEFGYSVAMSGDMVVVGAFADKDVTGFTNVGAAYIFQEPAAGWAGTVGEIAKLTASDPSTARSFGLGVAIDDDLIAVRGTAEGGYLFERPAGGWASMTESASLGFAGPSGVAVGDDFLVVEYSFDFALLFGRTALQVENIDTNEDTGDGSLAEAESVRVAVTQMSVTFNSEVADPAGDGDANDVTNPANYLLVEAGANGAFDTVDCAGGVVADDLQVSTGAVIYDSGSLTSTVTVNSGVALPAGMYHLHVCGSTSIESPSGEKLDGDADGSGGDDFVRSFSIADTDGDGDPDYSDPDDDGDGMSDDFENAHPGLDPLNAGDADVDLDSDGLTNLEEFDISPDMNPNDPDTDGDGLQDDRDDTPVTANSLCGGDMATLDGVSITDAQQCAAAVSVTIEGSTSVGELGDLEVISPGLHVDTVSVLGALTVTTADPCPACP